MKVFPFTNVVALLFMSPLGTLSLVQEASAVASNNNDKEERHEVPADPNRNNNNNNLDHLVNHPEQQSLRGTTRIDDRHGISRSLMNANEYDREVNLRDADADYGLPKKDGVVISKATRDNHEQQLPKKFVSLPLLPHHAVRTRRLRELGLVSDESNLFDLDNDGNNDHEDRRRRYRHRRMSSHTTPNENEAQDHSHHYKQLGALYQGYGTHYIDLWVGSPNPQRQTVIVDTGSGITAFPCSNCRYDCGKKHHIDDYFAEGESRTFQRVPCATSSTGKRNKKKRKQQHDDDGDGGGENECLVGYCSGKQKHCHVSMSYQEGSSWKAFEGRDLVYAGGLHDEPLMIDTKDDNEKEDEEDRSKMEEEAQQKLTLMKRNGEEGEGEQQDDDTDMMPTSGDDPRYANDFAFELNFGCQTSLTGLFRTQLADGIMGMENDDASFWKQMYKSGVISQRKFALCFNRQPLASREGTTAGAITFGDVDGRLHSTEMVYATNIQPNEGWYTVHIRAIYLRVGGGNSIVVPSESSDYTITKVDAPERDLNYGGVIVDSGTTDTYLQSSLKDPFSKLWKELTGRSYTNNAVIMSEEQVRSLPTVLIQLAGVPASKQQATTEKMNGDDDNAEAATPTSPPPGLVGELDPHNPNDVLWAIPPTHYMEYSPDSGRVTSRLYLTEGTGGVLGANAMMGHDIFFDMEEGRVGIAESDCDYVDLTKGEEEESQ